MWYSPRLGAGDDGAVAVLGHAEERVERVHRLGRVADRHQDGGRVGAVCLRIHGEKAQCGGPRPGGQGSHDDSIDSWFSAFHIEVDPRPTGAGPCQVPRTSLLEGNRRSRTRPA